ncbi:MAG: hypothetical protein GKR91_04955 [Pseudomonadales bacterium]|nr:hypothetical protein [Pseudomonadales bacterium]
MSEAELISTLIESNSLMWTILQWWVSFSFAVMVAAYVGAERLTRRLIAIICGMYFIAWLAVASNLIVLSEQNGAIFQELDILREADQLSLVGLSRLDSAEGLFGVPTAMLFLLSIFFTYGFVLYCYKSAKRGQEVRASSGT